MVHSTAWWSCSSFLTCFDRSTDYELLDRLLKDLAKHSEANCPYSIFTTCGEEKFYANFKCSNKIRTIQKFPAIWTGKSLNLQCTCTYIYNYLINIVYKLRSIYWRICMHIQRNCVCYMHLNTRHLFSMGQPLLNELHCLSRHFLLDGIQARVGMASMEGHYNKTLKTCWLCKLPPTRIWGKQPLCLPAAIKNNW